MTQPYKLCPQCQQSAELNAQACARCGRVFRTRFTPSPDQTQVVNPAPAYASKFVSVLTCVGCGNHATTKVSALVNSGQWSADTTGVSLGAGHVFGGPNFATVGVNTSNTQGASDLARMLAAPGEPKRDHSPACLVGCGAPIALLGCGMLLTSASSGQDVLAVVLLAIVLIAVGCGVLALAFRGHKSAFARYNEDYNSWRRQMAAWQNLSYCSRCDRVFNPQTKQIAEPRNYMNRLW